MSSRDISQQCPRLDASFSENFYGLKRRRRPHIETERARAASGGIPSGERLGNREIGRSLWFLVRFNSTYRVFWYELMFQGWYPLLAGQSP